tara:strand:+ start:97 stop:291 length:195 start_codon:yes stop_codon:yes gene_type:complete
MTVPNKILIGTLALIAFAWVNNSSFEDELAEQQHYCEMVSIYESSEGQHGWPNFKQLNCKKKGN